MTKLIPVFDRVLIKRESLQEQASRIHIPEDVDKRERPARGVVVAMGPLCGYVDEETKKIVREFEIGDRVVFGRHAGVEIQIDADKWWLCSDRDVLCRVEEA